MICVFWRCIFELMFFHISLASVLLDMDVHEWYQGGFTLETTFTTLEPTFTTLERLQDPAGRKRRSNTRGSGLVEVLFLARPRKSDLRENTVSVRGPATQET